MVDAFRLSDDFAEKAESDLELAQRISTLDMPGSRAEPRKPGHALGTCMYNAQQALEKKLKSLVLLLDAILDVSHDDDSVFLAKCLNHPIYPAMHRYYFERLDLLRPAGDTSGYVSAGHPDDGIASSPNRREAQLRLLCDHWDKYSRNYPLRLIAWKRSVGLRLEKEERQDIDSEHKTYAGLLASLTNRGSLDPSLLGRPPPTISTHECLDAGALERRRAEHAAGNPASWLSATLDQEFRKCRSAVQFLDGDSHTARDAYMSAARRAMLEFGLMLTLCHSVPYMTLLPHNTLGRYPQKLGDLTTTDLYGRQAKHVLHYLFVDVPHSVNQLSSYSGRIASLWEKIAGS